MPNHLVSQYFEADHQRLDRAFSRFRELKSESLSKARPYFKIFLHGLKRHILWEEDVLFPFFEEKTGAREQGPTAVMRQEHVQIRQLLDHIHEQVRRSESSSDEEDMLLEILEAHNHKEEQVLYPAMDQLLTDQETARVFLDLETIPAERYESCCSGHS